MTTFSAGEGRTLSYTRRGAGRLVVCIPGGPGMDPEAYFAAMDLPGYEMLVFAPRGTGDSSPPSSPDGHRIAGYVADVESLREHLGTERLTIYGNSHGGCVTLAYAAGYPERVERFVIVNAPARMDGAYSDAVTEAEGRFADAFEDGAVRLAHAEAAGAALQDASVQLSDERRGREFRTLMARYVAHEGPAEVQYLDRLCAAPMNWDPVPVMYDEFLDGLDLLAGADAVTAPALVLAGEYDVTVPRAAMRLIADVLPNAGYVEMAGAGHFVEVETPAAFTAAVTEFLSAGA